MDPQQDAQLFSSFGIAQSLYLHVVRLRLYSLLNTKVAANMDFIHTSMFISLWVHCTPIKLPAGLAFRKRLCTHHPHTYPRKKKHFNWPPLYSLIHIQNDLKNISTHPPFCFRGTIILSKSHQDYIGLSACTLFNQNVQPVLMQFKHFKTIFKI